VDTIILHPLVLVIECGAQCEMIWELLGFNFSLSGDCNISQATCEGEDPTQAGHHLVEGAMPKPHHHPPVSRPVLILAVYSLVVWPATHNWASLAQAAPVSCLRA
jgi:hypothetical protein